MRHFIAVATIVAAVLSGCCKDQPENPVTPPEPKAAVDLITNGAFRCKDIADSYNLDDTYAVPWRPATRTPQLCPWPGYDGVKGYIQMWGSNDMGESVYQQLVRPIRKGKTYVVKARVRWMEQDPLNYHRYVKVRFLAVNGFPSDYGYWRERHPEIAVIGTVRTADSNWGVLTTQPWTADADYDGFSFNAENDHCECDDPHNHSWAQVDDLQLLEMQ